MVWQKEEDFLAGFLFLAVIGHGMFFAREWLVLGTVFLIGSFLYRVRGRSAGKIRAELGKVRAWRNPEGIFMVMVIFSLTGLLQPVRSVEAWLEALRWLVFLIAFLWGKHLAGDKEAKEKVLERILWVAFIATVLTWLPGSEEIWFSTDTSGEERFASSFGYPNAAAAFLGCQLLLLPKDKEIRLIFLVVFVLSLLNTASRAAIVLLILFTMVLIVKKSMFNLRNRTELASLGFYESLSWKSYSKGVALVIMIFLLQQNVFHCQGSLQHLLNWTDTSLPERMVYYWDSIKIAWDGNFLPQAGGWLAFPFVQTIPYWTLDPHSSLCRIMLNQGLAAVIILGIWAVKGIKGYVTDLIWGQDFMAVCSKTAALYLGLHSLIDVDMSFGALGILFWLLVGLNTKSQQEQTPSREETLSD